MARNVREEREQELASVKIVDMIMRSYDALPDSEKTVADFILNNIELAPSLTATQIARKSGTSNTTVSRFVRSIGFSSFSEMRYALVREDVSKGMREDAPSGIDPKNVTDSMRFIMQTKIDELEATVSMLDAEAVSRVVDTLLHARTVTFVGVGSSLSIAQSAAVKFTQAGVNAFSHATSDAAQLSTVLLGPEDCLVVLSNSGYSARLQRVMDGAIDSGMSTVVITRNAASDLARRADVVLPVSSYDYLLVDSFDFSHNAINLVLEILLLMVFHSSQQLNEYNLRLFNEAMAEEKGGHAGKGGAEAAPDASGARAGLASLSDRKDPVRFCRS